MSKETDMKIRMNFINWRDFSDVHSVNSTISRTHMTGELFHTFSIDFSDIKEPYLLGGRYYVEAGIAYFSYYKDIVTTLINKDKSTYLSYISTREPFNRHYDLIGYIEPKMKFYEIGTTMLSFLIM